MRSNSTWAGLVIAVIGLLGGLVGGGTFAAPAPRRGAAAGPDAGIRGPIVQAPVRMDVSPALREVPPIPPQLRPRRLPETALHRGRPRPGVASGDPVVQRLLGPLAMPTPLQNFEGIANGAGSYPPDPTGGAGPGHYVQMVNAGFQIWNKNGGALYGPAAINTLWQGFGGPCQTSNDGNPTVLYDPLANRWLLTQVALPGFPDGPSYQCIAVSQTGDRVYPKIVGDFVAKMAAL